MFFIYLLAVLTVFLLLFFCGPYHCGICKKVCYIKRYRLKINGKWPLVCSQCLAHSLSENRQPTRKINDNKTKSLKTKEGISVTAFVSRVSQPRGDYIKRNQLNKIELPDAYHLDFELENIHPSLVGIAVDYLTRYMLFGNKNKSFDISIKGSLNMGEVDKAMLLIEGIDTSLSDISIINACKLAGYDVAYRRGPHYFKNIDSINPDGKCIENIKTMIYRSIVFFKSVNVIDSGMSFEGGYTNKISKGDADYLSNNTLWDLKVLRGEPNKNHTLQILVYTILLKRTPKYKGVNVDFIVILNPRFNCSYTFKIDELDKTLLNEIHELVGN